MVGEPVFTPADLVAEHLDEMARALRSGRAGAYRRGAIAYLNGRAAIWGEPNLWRELPREVRDAMAGAACDLEHRCQGAEAAGAEKLLNAAHLLRCSYDEVELDANDFSLDFGAWHEGVA